MHVLETKASNYLQQKYTCNISKDVNYKFTNNSTYNDKGRLCHHESTSRGPKPTKSWMGAKQKA